MESQPRYKMANKPFYRRQTKSCPTLSSAPMLPTRAPEQDTRFTRHCATKSLAADGRLSIPASSKLLQTWWQTGQHSRDEPEDKREDPFADFSSIGPDYLVQDGYLEPQTRSHVTPRNMWHRREVTAATSRSETRSNSGGNQNKVRRAYEADYQGEPSSARKPPAEMHGGWSCLCHTPLYVASSAAHSIDKYWRIE
jgi:hypothetical protein